MGGDDLQISRCCLNRQGFESSNDVGDSLDERIVGREGGTLEKDVVCPAEPQVDGERM